uniref:Uncharacterized protein n=1 Tax=Glossina austeni TaxID=7395 RepID=A0A1A9UTN1_GLOAU
MENKDALETLCCGSTPTVLGLTSRDLSMRPLRGVNKKKQSMDYTNYAYKEAVGRLKLMLADSYSSPKRATLRSNAANISADSYSSKTAGVERPTLGDISKYLTPSQKSHFGSYRSRRDYNGSSGSQENIYSSPVRNYGTSTVSTPNTVIVPSSAQPAQALLEDFTPTSKEKPLSEDCVTAPAEIFEFIERQDDYIEQLEKESKYCRHELSNLLGKVREVIDENEQLTENTRKELKALADFPSTNLPSENEDFPSKKRVLMPRKKEIKSSRYGSAPNILYEARISELEAELTQAHIDLKRTKTENEELKKKLANEASDTMSNNGQNCDIHRKQIEFLQKEKASLEETIRHLQKCLDETKSQQLNATSNRYINDLVQMERSQAELEVKHLRDELDRQHERVRELQHDMARRLAEERASAERRYNNQFDQMGGDLNHQWDNVTKLQLEVERQKRYESDLKRELANRNGQIEDLKTELRSNRSTFLADMAQLNAEKQSLEQDITALRLQLDRASRDHKTEAARLNAEINSLRQRLDRADADLLHSKREVLRLNDDIANLEKELAYGELKNEIRPTKKDLDKRISEMQDKHAETVNELEDMIQSQKQLMDKLTNECRTLTKKLEDTTIKHKTEISSLQSNVEYLTNRVLMSLAYKPSTFDATDKSRTIADDYIKSGNSYSYEPMLGKASVNDSQPSAIADDYKPKYDATSTPGYDYKSQFNDNDDENLKDISEGEKKQQQPIEHPQQNANASDRNTNANNSGATAETAENTADRLADYNTNYNAYDEYDQQQYDAAGYDGTNYEPQQYGNEGYDAGVNQTDYEYREGDYETAGYQYEATNETGEATAIAEQQNQDTNVITNVTAEPEPIKITATPTAQKPTSSNVAPSKTSKSSASAAGGSGQSNESRTQSRAGGSSMGSGGSAGTGATGKSSLSQQPASATGKKFSFQIFYGSNNANSNLAIYDKV